MKVVFCTPTIVRPHPAYVAALGASVPLITGAGWEEGLIFEIGNPYISAARATMLRKALDAKADVVVFIDHDLSWQPLDLLRLLETPGDVVAGTYRFKKDEVEYMGNLAGDAQGLIPVRADYCVRALAAPAGFLKVTAAAVDRFMGAFPELCYGPRYCPSVDLFNHGAHEGVWYGEDYAFSRRWCEIGDLWIVPNLSLDHHSETAVYPGNLHHHLLQVKTWPQSAT